MTTRSPAFPRRFVRSIVPLLLLLLLLSGCDEGELLPPDPEAGALFDRYVALGNSITAGFQSGGINAETQLDAYPVLLAKQMGHEIGDTFNIPAFAAPGCPPPITNIFTGEQRGGPEAPECRLREQPIPTTLHNVAVPGAVLADILTNAEDEDARPNPLTTLILGGRTQIGAAEAIRPTFATVWIGNNDVLNAARSGTPDLATPTEVFASRYTEMLDRLEQTGIEGGVLVGVANATLIPYFSPGIAYFEAAQQGALPEPFDVADSCAPAEAGGVGASTLVPFAYGFGVLLTLAQEGVDVTLDCADDRPLGEIFDSELVPSGSASVSLLTSDEIQTLEERVAAYNDAIEQAAEERGLAYLNPNVLFTRPEIREQIPRFPNVSAPDAPFGPYFSLDGVHPSSEAHVLIADALIETIDGTYDTNIPPISDGDAE